MQGCKDEIEGVVNEGVKKEESRNMRKNTSFMSLDDMFMGAEQVSKHADGSQTQRQKPTLSLSQKDSSSSEKSLIDPTYILDKAYSKVKAVGSSTAMIAILNPKSVLTVSNLGDSGFLHYR